MLEQSRDIPMETTTLFWKVKGDATDLAAVAYYLEYIALHMRVERIVPALTWLIRNQLTGNRFLDFVYNDCAKSGLELIRNLTMRLERESSVRKLFAKDLQL